MFFLACAIAIIIGAIAVFLAALILNGLGSFFQLWRILPERTVLVYTLFGKVIGQVDEPGLFFPVAYFGIKALIIPIFGKAYAVRTYLLGAYLRAQSVNSEEGAPMSVGIWCEFFVGDPSSYLFKNSSPLGSLKANVSTAVVKQLSNLKLDVLLEDRDALSRKVREEVTPTSQEWGFELGSTYIRKVSFRDTEMILEIQRKVVNRLRQVTAGMKQAGDNKVALIHSDADMKAAARLGQAQAMRPKIVGAALAKIQANPDVAQALFRLLEINASVSNKGKVVITEGGTSILVSA